MAIVWREGEFLDETEFRVSPSDRGLCHGLSLFETILAVEGRPRLLAEHLRRMRNGLVRLNLHQIEIDEYALERVMMALLERNGLQFGMARIRFTVSLGDGPLNFNDSGRSWKWITVSRVDPSEESIRLTIAPWRKDNESMLRGIKVGSYAEHLVALDLARCEGFDEMLFFNTSDEICEAAMANVFLIRDNELFTPGLDSGCLAGVTREHILQLASAQKIPCHARTLGKKDLAKADGIFLTSSIRGPVWVAAFQGKAYPNHPLFSLIHTLWLESMRK
jgi:branched-chain amino acid aminotransferase